MDFGSFYQLLFILLCFRAVKNENVDDWSNPKDMLRYNPMTQKMSTPNRHESQMTMDSDQEVYTSCCNPLVNLCTNLKRCCRSCPAKMARPRIRNNSVDVHTDRCRESIFMARYVNRLLYLFNDLSWAGETSFNVEVKLTRDDLNVLRRYSTSKGSIQDVERVLSQMMINVEVKSWIEEVKEALAFQEWRSFFEKNILYVVSCIAMLWMLQSLVRYRWYTSMFHLFFVLFVISVAWEMQRQYLLADAAKRVMRQRFSQVPKECNPESLSYWQSFLALFNNRCQEYYEAMIDSHWDVSPIMVATTVLTRTFPLFGRGLGGSIAEFYNVFYDYFSFFGLIIMFPIATLILVIIIVYPCTTYGRMLITAQFTTAASVPTRQMVEDVDVDGRQQPMPIPTATHPIVQHHHHHYYLTSGSNVEPMMTTGNESDVLPSQLEHSDSSVDSSSTATERIKYSRPGTGDDSECNNEDTTQDSHQESDEAVQNGTCGNPPPKDKIEPRSAT